MGSNPTLSAILLRAKALRRIGTTSLAKQGAPAVSSRRYVGLTTDLKRRLGEHNSGKPPHTAKFLPWRLVTYIAFSVRGQAEDFERYLKSGSGHAFANKRLW